MTCENETEQVNVWGNYLGRRLQSEWSFAAAQVPGLPGWCGGSGTCGACAVEVRPMGQYSHGNRSLSGYSQLPVGWSHRTLMWSHMRWYTGWL